MEKLLQDVRHALRGLAREPGFAAVALVTIALGIGANVLVFSVVHAVVLRPLPYTDPEQLVRIGSDFERPALRDAGISPLELFDLQARTDLFSGVSGLYRISANMTDVDDPQRVETLLVDTNYFALLGVRAQLGRVFTESDYAPGIAEVAVISDDLWRRTFGGDPGVVGKRVRIDGDAFTILGVAPASFHHPGSGVVKDVELWAPSGWKASPYPPPARGTRFMQGALARLRPDVGLGAGRDGIAALVRDLRAQNGLDYPASAGWSLRIESLQDDVVARVRPALLTLLGAVGFVLLIACANVANLMRCATTRRLELAVRQALGAGTARLLRQRATEAAVLWLLGGAIGLALAVRASRAARAEPQPAAPRPGDRDRRHRAPLHRRAIAGERPSLRPPAGLAVAKRSHQDALKEASRIAGADRARVRSFLVVSEIALALVLLVGAGLLLRSAGRLHAVDPGFRTDHVLTANLWLPQPNLPETGPYFRHEARGRLYRQILERLAQLPGVTHAAGATSLPLDGSRASVRFTVEGREPAAGEVLVARSVIASPDYFPALGIALRRGRLFGRYDDERAPGAALVNEAFARRIFPGEDPIGHRLQIPARRHQRSASLVAIVGVVADVKADGLEVESPPVLYRSLEQDSSLAMSLLVRTAGAPGPLGDALRREVRRIAPDQPVYGVRTFDELASAAVGPRRFITSLLGLFALCALVLAAVGIHGVMAYSVSRRGPEIGLRMALGAGRPAVLRLVLGQGLALTAAGIGLGLLASAALSRALAGFLFGVSPTDPLTFGGIAALIVVVALVACALPARRAASVDPLVALREG